MKFLFFGLGEWRKWTRVMKGLMGAMPQNIWARTAPGQTGLAKSNVSLSPGLGGLRHLWCPAAKLISSVRALLPTCLSLPRFSK